MKLYKFYKPGCSPCSTLGKIMKWIDLPEDIEFVEVDITDENNKELVSEFGINAVPVLAFETGKQLVGVKAKPQTESFIKSYGD